MNFFDLYEILANIYLNIYKTSSLSKLRNNIESYAYLRSEFKAHVFHSCWNPHCFIITDKKTNYDDLLRGISDNCSVNTAYEFFPQFISKPSTTTTAMMTLLKTKNSKLASLAAETENLSTSISFSFETLFFILLIHTFIL